MMKSKYFRGENLSRKRNIFEVIKSFSISQLKSINVCESTLENNTKVKYSQSCLLAIFFWHLLGTKEETVDQL